MKWWSIGIFAGIVLLALGIVTFVPGTIDNQDFSGMVTKDKSSCVASCNELTRFYFNQGDSANNINSYTIQEGDYFLVTLNSLTDKIVSVYRNDGLILSNPENLRYAQPYQNTGNYLKLSLLYAKIHSLTTNNKDETLQPFNCDGKQILVPIINPGYVGKEISFAEDHANRAFYLANVQIKPFEDAGMKKFIYNTAGKQLPDFNIAAVSIKGVYPYGFDWSKVNQGKVTLLVDLDGDGHFGGDTSIDQIGLGLCSSKTFGGNLPGQVYTSYRSK